MDVLRSALMVEIPEAEAAVGESRLRLDPVAALGVPAHVTALFPFVAANLIDDSVLRRVGVAAGSCAPFDYRFIQTAWFGQDVVFLAPEDPRPFVELTERLCAAFPDCPPFGGQFAAIVPHLTIGDGADAAQLHLAEARVLAHGMVAGRALRLTLMTEDATGRWSRLGWCRLGSDQTFEQA